MIARIGMSLLLVAALATPALPQGGCRQLLLWGLSGSSSLDPNNPTSSEWLADIAQQEAAHGGVPDCQYTWIYVPPGFNNVSHWSGECAAYYWTCPVPPPNGSQETGSCPTCPGTVAGKPINLANGNVYIQQNDIKVPGLGNGLTLARTWNSIWPSSQAASNVGIFGPNWRSTYEERVFLGEDGTVKYARSDGSFWSFELYNPPTYQLVAPANGRATLIYSDSDWEVVFENGEQRLFSTISGSLVAIIDRNGNTTQLTYNATNQLTTVTDPASRQLSFNYGTGNNSNLVTSVTSSMGISLGYAYDGQGRLITVTEPDQTTVSFQYNNNSMITAVLDSNGTVLESHTYDTYGRGLTSARAGGVEAVTVSYPTQ